MLPLTELVRWKIFDAVLLNAPLEGPDCFSETWYLL